jgi:hypothetical protein
MNTQHTKAPWHVTDEGSQIVIQTFSDHPTGTIARIYGTGFLVDANAQRIVACVNACEGINPEAVSDLLKALQCFTELAAPCMSREAEEGFRYHTAENAYRVELSKIILSVKEAARAAIAKATGQESEVAK